MGIHFKYVFFVVILFSCGEKAIGQDIISFKDTINTYNAYRIKTDKIAMKTLGAWGIANIAVGSIGYFTSNNNNEWRYFNATNAASGIINAAIAGITLNSISKEADMKLNPKQYYKLYIADKQQFLLNAGIDVVLIGSSLFLMQQGKNDIKNSDLYNGIGKSIVIQGVFRLMLDDLIYTMHLRNNSKWVQIMHEINISNYGIGLNHRI